jgi:hypothetical protein
MTPDGVQLIERYGSFGLLVLFAGWVVAWVVPKVLQAFREQAELFRKESQEARAVEKECRQLDRAEWEQHRKEAAERHEHYTEGQRQVSDVLSDLAHAVRRIADSDDSPRYGRGSADPATGGDSGKFPKRK